MAVQDVVAKRGRGFTPSLEIIASPAHEFLMTLHLVIDDGKINPEQAYEVGDEWFKMVREKATPALLSDIKEVRFLRKLGTPARAGL